LLPLPIALEPVRTASEPVAPNSLFEPDRAEVPSLLATPLETAGLPEEAIAQAQELAGQELPAEPSAPVAPLVELKLELAPAAPARAELRTDVDPEAFVPASPAAPQLELHTLRSRYVPGPNPHAKAPEPAPAEPAKPAAPPEPQQKPKISIRPAEPAKPARPEVRRPNTMVARSGAQAISQAAAQPAVQEVPEPEAAPLPAAVKAPVIPIRKPEAVAEAPAAPAPAAPMPEPALSLGSAAASGGMGQKIGIAVAAVAVLGGIGWFVFGGSGKRAEAPAPAAADVAQPFAPLGGAGWSAHWGADAAINKGKQISIYRPTMTAPDYRIELNAQIEKKALGWIFRAKDPQNYYVMKLEWIKPGPTPITALIRYAVVNGKETTHTQVLLPFENLSMTTMYKVRMDAKGSTFTTWVNERMVDTWTDDRVKIGGAGVYTETGERAAIKTINILALR
jgi:hypothetical protein